TDAQAFARWTGRAVELVASLGMRSGQRIPTVGGGGKAWGSVGATYWLTSRVGLVAGAGTYPVDLTQGFPGGRFATLSVRLTNSHVPQPSIVQSSASTRD